jgi:hypothetical protein
MNNPLCPITSVFVVKPNRWIRYWVMVKQVANDYDLMSAWVADEQTNPVQVYADVPMSLRSTGLKEFWAEFNTSENRYVRGSQRDLIAYVRNVVVLQDPMNPLALMLRPTAGVPLPVPPGAAPAAPRNLRIIS